MTDRPIRYESITLQEYAAAMTADGLPDDLVLLVSYLFTEVLDGRNPHIADGVQRALGREPRLQRLRARRGGRRGLERAMSSYALRSIALMGATITTGLVAGVFALYAHTIMPGLKTTDDRTFVGAFQALDRAIINPWFMVGGFIGALALTLAAAATNLHQPALPWIIAALVLYLVAFIAMIAVNVPLNDAIKAAGDPDHITNLAHVREQFHETRWAAWNLARTITSTTAFALLAWALVRHGRSGA